MGMKLRTGPLDWPEERVGGDGAAARFGHEGSNLCLDFHGDPLGADLTVFSDGNHHMALEESLRAFTLRQGGAPNVFYATLPPGVLVQALRCGGIQTGNLRLALRPHLFISPLSVLAPLHREGLVQPPVPFMRSRGMAFLVRRGNPKGIRGVGDLLRPEVRLFISNPVTEAFSFNAYAGCLRSLAARAGVHLDFLEEGGVEERTDKLCVGRLIHHREAPRTLAEGRADVALVYYHLALRYRRIFPETFELCLPEDGAGEPCCEAGSFHASLVGDGGPWGERLLDFLLGDEAGGIYESHGLARGAA